MKFGGTSVGDASCIARVAQIVNDAAKEGPIVAVVSAMSGVTNRLIEAANLAAAGESKLAEAMFAALRQQHETALAALVPRRSQAQADRRLPEQDFRRRRAPLPRHGAAAGADSAHARCDFEPGRAAFGADGGRRALGMLGARSESVEATELIVTDSSTAAPIR